MCLSGDAGVGFHRTLRCAAGLQGRPQRAVVDLARAEQGDLIDGNHAADVVQARAFKANEFNYVWFSGIFTKRSEKCFQHHSELMVLDFDHLSDVDGVKGVLLADKSLETVLLFRSPSGDGLKWVISIDIRLMDHKNYFKAVSNYLKATYQLEVDSSGKDVARACFLPYDPEVFINPKYLVYGKDI